MKQPAIVSVGIPVFNGAERLPETLATILAQDHPDLEIILSDNASTDGTEELCRDFARRDPRIRYFRQAHNTGMGANWSFVREQATGAYFIWAADDDRWSPNLLSTLWRALQDEPGAVMAFPTNHFINEQLETVIDCSSLPDLAGPWPLLQRLNHVLWFEEGQQKGNLVYSLIRTDAVQRMPFPTLATQAYREWGGDQLIVFALAFEGYFVYVPEAHFYKRYFPTKKYESDDLHEHVHEMQGYFARYRQLIQQSQLDPLSRDTLLASVAVRESVWYSRVLSAKGLDQVRGRLALMVEHCDQVRERPADLSTKRTRGNREPLTSIVILNYNGRAHLAQCLASIRKQTTSRYEVIVFDNASTDGSREWLRTVPDITLVESPVNLGCPPGRAQAIALAQGDYVLFLDNDTLVTPAWLSSFLAHMEADPEIGILGPRSNHVSGAQLVTQVAYANEYELGQFAKLWTWLARRQPTLIPAHRLVGFCMFIRRAVIERIGGPDPQFGKFGFEDDDYTLRAKVAGFRTMIANDIYIHHTGGPQSKGDPEYNRQMLEAWEVYRRKWRIPDELPCGRAYDVEALSAQPFDAARHFVPIPPAEEVRRHLYRRSPVAASGADLAPAPVVAAEAWLIQARPQDLAYDR
ncbi:MAG: glycosyltransferase [Pirellulaceae bacterium]